MQFDIGKKSDNLITKYVRKWKTGFVGEYKYKNYSGFRSTET